MAIRHVALGQIGMPLAEIPSVGLRPPSTGLQSGGGSHEHQPEAQGAAEASGSRVLPPPTEEADGWFSGRFRAAEGGARTSIADRHPPDGVDARQPFRLAAD